MSSPPRVRLLSPSNGAVLHSPLVVARIAYEGASENAVLRVGDALHVLELPAEQGVISENIALLEGETRLVVRLGESEHAIDVTLAPSEGIAFSHPPLTRPDLRERSCRVRGTYAGMTCPAGVISVNGQMQQIDVEGAEGRFSERILLERGVNHVAVQIGERYATRVLQGLVPEVELLVTAQWSSSKALDLLVREPSGAVASTVPSASWRNARECQGSVFIGRRVGFGPLAYGVGSERRRATRGAYRVFVKLESPALLKRTEWVVTARVAGGGPRQQTARFYGLFDLFEGRWDGSFEPMSTRHPYDSPTRGPWQAVCDVVLEADGTARFEPIAPAGA